MALTITPYVGQGWTDGSEPDLSAENLNAVDAGITANSEAINAIANAIVNQFLNDPAKIASAALAYSLKQSVDALNSNLGTKASASDLANLSAKIIGDGVNFTSIQVKSGSTWYRLQLGGDGAITVFKSSDSGVTWPQSKVISTGF